MFSVYIYSLLSIMYCCGILAHFTVETCYCWGGQWVKCLTSKSSSPDDGLPCQLVALCVGRLKLVYHFRLLFNRPIFLALTPGWVRSPVGTTKKNSLDCWSGIFLQAGCLSCNPTHCQSTKGTADIGNYRLPHPNVCECLLLKVFSLMPNIRALHQTIWACVEDV